MSRSKVGKVVRLAPVMSFLGACTTAFHEVHHLKTVDQFGQPINYYRVSIDGHTSGGSARYVSGYFDADAVEKYFNEFKQPKDGAFLEFDRPEPKPSVSLRGLAQSSDTEASLVMMLSTNTDAVAQGISTLAQNQEILRSLTLFAAKDDIEEDSKAVNGLATLDGQAVYLQKKGDAILRSLADTANQATAENTFLSYASSMAALLGYKGTFSNLEQAWNWLTSQE